MSSRDALAPGTRVLNDYVIERELCSDGFAITYRAVDERLDRRVAIIEYFPRAWAVRGADGTVAQRSGDSRDAYARGLGRFLDDARLLGKVDHHQIPGTFLVAEDNGTAYLVTEHARGHTLEERIRESGPLACSEVRTLLDDLAAGLAEVHALGVLHLDIRPATVVVRPDGTGVLAGLCPARASLVGETDGAVWGVRAPGFAAIEQYSPSGRRGAWTDIYALGATAYAALTGLTPVAAPERVRADTLPDLASAAAQPVDEPLASAVAAAMRVDESDRPQDLGSWRELLIAGPKRRGGRLAAWARRRPARIPRVGRRRLFYAAGVAVLAVGVATMVSVARNRALSPEQLAAAQESQLALSPATVTLVEHALAAEGFYARDLDGVLEDEARTALREWQASRGLDETGYLGRASLPELLELGREAEAAASEEAEEERLEAERLAGAERLEAERRVEEPGIEPSEAERLAEELRRAEAARRDAERAAAEAERLVEEARLAEEARLEAERLEEERLDAERRAEEASRAEEARSERERLEAERQAEDEREAEARRAEEERLEAERRAAAEREAEAARLAVAGEDEVLLHSAAVLAGPAVRLNWNAGVNWVRWTGVRLSGRNVTAVDLGGRNLGGSIPPVLGLLDEMRHLNLSGNRLTGSIPRELGSLRQLQVLYLEGNELSGPIPRELGSLANLEDLFLENNSLSGELPAELGNLGELRRLRVTGNEISGPIPAELGQLDELQVLALNGNRFSGEIPATLGELSSLRRLSLSYNRLSGCIPKALGRFESDINPQLDGVNLPRCGQ